MNESNQPAQVGSNDGLGLVERLRQRGNDLRSHPVANSTIDLTEQAGELLHEAADEIARLTGALKKANDQAEHFERLWYLTNEDAARYHFAKTLEGQVVTMETFKNRGASELDQALDDAMEEAADAQNERGYAA